MVVLDVDAEEVFELAAAGDHAKSQARIETPCARRKVRHDCRSRWGAGGSPAWARMFRTYVAEPAIPSLRSSPTIRK